MRKHELFTDYHDHFEYFGNTEIERIRKQGEKTIRHDWKIFHPCFILKKGNMVSLSAYSIQHYVIYQNRKMHSRKHLESFDLEVGLPYSTVIMLQRHLELEILIRCRFARSHSGRPLFTTAGWQDTHRS